MTTFVEGQVVEVISGPHVGKTGTVRFIHEDGIYHRVLMDSGERDLLPHQLKAVGTVQPKRAWFEYALGKWLDWNQILSVDKHTNNGGCDVYFLGNTEYWSLSKVDSVKILERIARELSVEQ